MSKLLEVKDLHVKVEDKEILKGVNLTVNEGEIHVIMGPNGSGKSTLINTIMGHPAYTVTEGDILYKGESILDKATDERSNMGIFMSFQAPEEIQGITVENFLRTAKIAHTGKSIGVLDFKKQLKRALKELDMDESYGDRYLNVGFSGGEKKKNEILQMKILDPQFVMLDETDSGLDIDAVRVVSKGIADFQTEEKSFLIITHYTTILEELDPDYVHVMVDGIFRKDGSVDLINRIEEEGYSWLEEEPVK